MYVGVMNTDDVGEFVRQNDCEMGHIDLFYLISLFWVQCHSLIYN